MDRETGLIDLEGWLAKVGLPEAVLEPQGEILIIKLSAVHRGRLLADPALRQSFIQQARSFGFSRIALELPLGEGGMLGKT